MFSLEIFQLNYSHKEKKIIANDTTTRDFAFTLGSIRAKYI